MSEVQAIADRVAMIREGVIAEVAETQSLIDRAVRHATIEFKEPVDARSLADLPGVRLLAGNGHPRVTFEVEGDIDPLVKALGRFPVRDLETSRPSLEELFLAYYETGERQPPPAPVMANERSE